MDFTDPLVVRTVRSVSWGGKSLVADFAPLTSHFHVALSQGTVLPHQVDMAELGATCGRLRVFAGLGGDYYSVSYQGYVRPDVDGPHRFYCSVRTDLRSLYGVSPDRSAQRQGGCRFYFEGASLSTSTPVLLNASKWYRYKLEVGTHCLMSMGVS